MTDLVRQMAQSLPEVRLADTQLGEATLARIERAPAPNTLLAYKRWIYKKWLPWCASQGRTPLPATAETLAEFASHLADAGTGVPSIRQAISAIRFHHAGAGYEGQPGMKLAKLALKSHARDQAAAGVRSGQATPILIDALRAMIDTCDTATPKGTRDRMILVLGWSAMLRRSELVALDLQDITETGDGLSIYIAASKTDQEAKGDAVLVPRGTHPDSDPVRVWTDWLAVLDHAGIDDGKLLRWIDNSGRIRDSLTGDAVNDIIKAAAQRAKLPNPGGYTAHSLRAGGATATYRNGATVSAIAEHGRWAKNSPVVLSYIRSVDKWKDNPMRGIGL